MTWYEIVFIIIAAAVIIMLAAGTYMFLSFGYLSDNFKKKKRRNCWDENEDVPSEVDMNPVCYPYMDELLEARKWVKSHSLESYEVKSYDGLTLRAKFLPAKDMRAIVLMMHGFRSSVLHDFSLAIKEYYDMGVGSFMPYQRAHGDSEGKYICYGSKERFDVVSWCRLIGEKFPGVPVILDGISMGASTVMYASALELPDNVKGIVADCGFTSVRDLMKAVIKKNMKMSPFPFYYTTALAAKIRAGIDPKLSTADALRKNRLPLFLAHGKADSLVPYEMSVENYEAAKGSCEVEFLTSESADHGTTFLKERTEYIKRVRELADKCTRHSQTNTGD